MENFIYTSSIGHGGNGGQGSKMEKIKKLFKRNIHRVSSAILCCFLITMFFISKKYLYKGTIEIILYYFFGYGVYSFSRHLVELFFMAGNEAIQSYKTKKSFEKLLKKYDENTL